MAPAAGRPQMDPARPSRRSSAARRPPDSADPAIGKGEPSLGLPPHPRQTEEAWNPRVGHHDPHGAAGQRTSTRTPTGIGHLAGVPSGAGLRHHRRRLLHVETVRLKTLYVLFFIELHTRQVRLAGVTDHPNGPWVVQRARELSLERSEGATAPRFLLRDRDGKFTRVFDDVFAADGTQVIATPVQAPNANAFAERWVRTVRQECLDWVLVWGRRHLERVLDEYVRHYNDERPHRGLALRPPRGIEVRAGPDAVTVAARVRRRDRLGGLIHEYYQVAA
jgi:Integrase core domain